MRGQFVFWPETERQLVVPNNIMDEGAESFLKMIGQDDQTDVAAGADFYIGMCGKPFTTSDTLATLAGEPSGAGGYSRKAVSRDNVGFPSITQENGIWKMQSKVVNFVAGGADFSVSIWRTFLCNVGAGTAGKLFAVSGPLQAAHLVVDGETFPVRYEIFLR